MNQFSKQLLSLSLAVDCKEFDNKSKIEGNDSIRGYLMFVVLYY